MSVMIFDNWRQWLKRTFPARRIPQQRPAAFRFRPTLENLEDRLVPATTTVTFISATSPLITNASSVTYTIIFADPTYNLSVSNLHLTGTAGIPDTDMAVTTTDHIHYTETTSGLAGANGTLTLNLASQAGLTDASNNPVTLTNTLPFAGDTYTLDTTPPTVTIGAPVQTATSITYTITYADTDFASSSLTTGDITLNKTGSANATVNVDSGTGATRTVTLTNITGSGSLGISIAAGTTVDQAGNLAPAAGPSATAEIGVSVVSISRGTVSQYSNAATVSYTITFSSAVTGLTASNLSLSGTAGLPAADIGAPTTTDNIHWTETISNLTTANGSLILSLANATGLNNTVTTPLPFAGDTYTLDHISPAVTISAPSVTFANSAATVTYGITFSDTNFNAASTDAAAIKSHLTFNAATGTTVNPANVTVTGSGTSYSVAIAGATGNGTIGISLTAGVASDLAGNQTAAAGPSTTFTEDNTAPTITIGAPTQATGTITYTVTYADTNFGSSTLASGNITVNNTGSAAAGTVTVTGTGTTRTVTLTNITGSGSLGISIAAGTASDQAGNQAPAAAPSTTVTVVSVTSISRTTPSVQFTNASSVTYTITFSSATTGLTATNLSLTGTAGVGTIGTPATTDGGVHWTVTITGLANANGTLILNLANSTGLSNTVSTMLPFAGDIYTLNKSAASQVFTSASSASFTAGVAGSFRVKTSGSPAPTYSLVGAPSWLHLNATTGVLSGTPPKNFSGVAQTFSFTINASNGISQYFTLKVLQPRRRGAA
jgi:Putative Ig domain